MSEVNDAATTLYNRLRSAPTFHPAGADLFTDWNVQAGDVVTVKSGTDSYQVPIYNMRLKWSGAPKIEVESTGNPEREPLPAIKRREYSAQAGNYAAQKSLRGGVSGLQDDVANINGEIIGINGDITEIKGTGVFQNSERITEVAGKFTVDGQGNVHVINGSQLYLGEGSGSLAVYKDGDISAAFIASQINGGTAIIQGNHISMTANTDFQSVVGDIATQGTAIEQNTETIRLKVSKGDVLTQLSVEAGNVSVSGGNLVVSGYVTSQGLITTMGDFSGSIHASGSIGTPSSMAAASITLDGESLTSYVMSLATNLWTVAADGDINLEHSHAITMSESGGVVTATVGAVQLAQGTATFNIAATQFYKNGVAAAWTNAANTARINNDVDGPGSSSITLAPGESVTVFAQIKANSSATLYTTVGTVYVSASGGGGGSDFQLGSVKSRNSYAIGASVYVNYYLNGQWHSETKTVQQE